MTTAYRCADFVNSIGVVTHILYTDGGYANIGNIIADLQYLGVNNVRDTITDGTGGSAPLSSYETIAATGVQFCFGISGPGQQTTSGLTAQMGLIETVATNYPGSVFAVEGLNELNNQPSFSFNGVGGMTGAIALQEAIYSQTKASSALTGVSVVYFTGYDNTVNPQTTPNLCDYDNQHPYPANGSPPLIYVNLATALTNETAPYGPAVYTETGYSTQSTETGFYVNENVQAKYTLDMLFDCFTIGIKKTYLYQLFDPYNPGSPQGDDGFGLFEDPATGNTVPKQSGTAIHNLTTLFQDNGSTRYSFTPGGFSYSVSGLPASGQTALFQKSNGVFVIVVWAEPAIWDNSSMTEVMASIETVTISLPLEFTITVYDPMTGTSAIAGPTTGSSVTVSLTDHPLIIQLGASMTVNPTAIYHVYKSGSNNNGGGYDPAISGAGTDYSQQTSAQTSGTNGAASGTTTFTDATATSFTSAMVGNSINITAGSGFTAGVYFVTAYSSSSVITLDRSPGSGTGATWALGGAWADFWTNNQSGAAWIVPGTTIMIQGGGTDTPASPDYTYSGGGFCPNFGDNINGLIRWIGFNGRPMIAADVLISYPGFSYQWMENLYFQVNSPYAYGNPLFQFQDRCTTYNCVFDQNGYDSNFFVSQGIQFEYCEFFSSVANRGGTPSSAACGLVGNMSFCTVHDCLAQGILANDEGECWLDHCIIANNGKEGCCVQGQGNADTVTWFSNNTFYNNGGNGSLWFDCSSFELVLPHFTITNNIFANNTGSGIFYTSYYGASPGQAGRRIGWCAGNAFYGNGTDVAGITLPSEMSNTYGTNPGFAAPGTENFTLPGTSSLYNTGMTLPINRLAGKTNTTAYNTPGVSAPPASAGGSQVAGAQGMVYMFGRTGMVGY